ncbi:type IV secretion system protein [Labrys sp. 22185]|uniref:type IV secretion system protein n=1 Tax=Labrys sp. 22185 TaxID=3453888 RepID=UPI003F87D0C9
MNAADIFGALFGRIDSLGNSMVQQLYQALTQSLAPIFWAFAAIAVVWWGYEMIAGRVGLSGSVFAWRVGRIALIYMMAFSWTNFSPLVADVMIQTPNGVAATVCSAVQATGCDQSSSSMSQALSNIWATAQQASRNITAAGGWTGVGLMILGIVILVIVGLLLAIAAALLILGKMALFLMLATAPIFIAMALFQFTSGMFTGWMTTMFQYGLVLPVVVYGILGIMLVTLNATMNQLAAQISDGSATVDMTLVAPFVLMCGVSSYLLLQAPNIAAGIVGGARLEAGRLVSPMLRAAALARNATGYGIAAGALQGARGVGYGVNAARNAWTGRNAALEAAVKSARS